MREFFPVAICVAGGIGFLVGMYVGARLTYWLRGPV